MSGGRVSSWNGQRVCLSLQRILGDAPGGRPTPAEPKLAGRVIELATSLAHDAAVLHDVSKGGLAVAVAEVCIASGVGARLDSLSAAQWFSEDPHRLVVVIDSDLELPADIAVRIGTIGGDRMVLGDIEVSLTDAAERWHNAIPHALAD